MRARDCRAHPSSFHRTLSVQTARTEQVFDGFAIRFSCPYTFSTERANRTPARVERRHVLNFLQRCYPCDCSVMHHNHIIGDFRVAFRLCFKASPCEKPFIWKLVLFTCKWTKICVWIKLISIWKASHLDSLWNRGKMQLGNRLGPKARDLVLSPYSHAGAWVRVQEGLWIFCCILYL